MKQPEVIIYNLEQAVCIVGLSVEDNINILLTNADWSLPFCGIDYYININKIINNNCNKHKFLMAINCGNNPGYVISALRQGVKLLQFSGEKQSFDRLSTIAKKCNAIIRKKANTKQLDLFDITNIKKEYKTWIKNL